jgi:hypothetical protein
MVRSVVTWASYLLAMVDWLGIASLGISGIAVGLSGWGAKSAKDSALSADKSAVEARRSRLDVLGPQVSVGPVVALRERWHYGQYTHPGDLVHPPAVAAPGTEYPVPLNGSVRVMLGVWIPIRNEGDRSVTVQVTAFRVDRCDSEADIERVLSPPAETPSPLVRNAELHLEPRSKMGVIARDGPTVDEWRQMGSDRPVQVSLTATAAPEGPSQHWNVVIAAPLLQPKFGEEGRFLVRAHELPQVLCTQLPRTYPGDPAALSTAQATRRALRWPR